MLISKVGLFTLLLFAGPWSRSFATRYVAINGIDDGRDGIAQGSPLRTIQRAHDLASVGEEIIVGPGTYFEQVTITKDNLKFRAQNGPNTTFINGTDLLGGWTRVGTTNTWKTSAMTWDLTRKFGENQLFQDTTMILQLRWPKNVSTDIVMPTMAKADGGTKNSTAKTTTILDSDFKGGTEWVGAQIFINLAHHGFDGQGWVGTVTAASPGSITCDQPHSVGETVWAVGADTEYYLFNPKQGTITDENVDGRLGNGEWYKNGTGTSSTLYVKTGDGSQPNSTLTRNVYAKRRYFGFAGNGKASGYTVDGFNLFGCSVTTFVNGDLNLTGDPTGCTGVSFKNLNIKYISHQLQTGDYQLEHAGWTGLVLNGSDHRAENCTITYSATCAISIQGNRHKVLNNKIYNTNYMCSTAGAINTGRYNNGSKKSLDLEIGYNLISNTTVAGIYISNLRNSDENKRGVARVHHNTIVDYSRRSADCGGIETGFTDMQWARIDHNYIYNTLGHDLGKYGNRLYGIYFDFGSFTDDRIRGIADHNVVTNTQRPMTINNGTDVEVFNNVLIGSEGTPYSITNGVNQSGHSGLRYHIFNNILSHPIPNGTGGSLANARFTNNITDATIDYIAANPIFVGPKFTGAARKVTDFILLDNSTTRSRLIDKGNLTYYNEAGVSDIDPVTGNPDLGVYEWQTITELLEGTTLENIGINVFPNPVSDGWLTVGINGIALNTSIEVTLSDLCGRIVYEGNFNSVGMSQRLNIGTIQPGVYVISVSDSNTKIISNITVLN